MQMKQPAHLDLLHTLSEENANDIIPEIDLALGELTQDKFLKYARQLALYGDLLFNKTYTKQHEVENRQMYARLQNLYQHLRRIGKLSVNENILSFNANMKKRVAYLQYLGTFEDSFDNGSYAYFYAIYCHNKLLAERGAFSSKLIKSLIPHRIDWIDEKNLDHCIMIAIKGFREDILAKFMKYFLFPKRLDLYNLFMRYALEYGRCDAVEWLLTNQIALPDNINETGITFKLAVFSRNHRVATAFLKKYSTDQIFIHYLQNEDYQFSANHLKTGHSTNFVTLKHLAIITEIAASCGDIEALKVFLNACNETDRVVLFKQHIEPHFIPAKSLDQSKDDQLLFNQAFIQSVSIIAYHMKKGKFCFSLTQDNHNFTLVKCGELRKSIAYSVRADQHYIFGTIRSAPIDTVCEGKLINYRDRTETLIEQKGQVAQKESLTLLPYKTQERELKISAQLPTCIVTLTTLRKTIGFFDENIPYKNLDISCLWTHTALIDIPPVIAYVQNVWLLFCHERKQEHTLKIRIAALRLLATIHYYFASTCLYMRGTAAIGEAIISGAAETIELDHLRNHQEEMPDCVAMTTLTCDEYIENYPKIYGFNSYEEMVIKLHEEFNTRMSSKESALQSLRTLIQCVGDKQHSILYSDYSNFYESKIKRPFAENTIEGLIKELRDNGPILVTGRYGQAFYAVNPVSLTHNFVDKKISVHGWTPNTFKDNSTTELQEILLVGAKIEGEKKYVYYMLTTMPLSQQQIFVISFSRFMESLNQKDSNTDKEIFDKHTPKTNF